MLNKIRNFFLYTIISGIILLAIGISVARVLLPDVQTYRSYIEEQLGTILERPVKIGDMNAFLSGITPVVVFHDVKLMSQTSKQRLLEISKIKIGFSLWRSIHERKAVPSIYTIDGIELAITRKNDGKILIQDVDVAELSSSLSEQEPSNNTELSEWLFNRSSLVIQNSAIIWHDKKRKTKPAYFSDVTLKLKNSLNRHQFNGEFTLSKGNVKIQKKLELALDVYGDMLDPIKWVGKFHANGKNISSKEWGFKPVIMDVMVEQGQLDFSVWGDWVAGELNAVEAEVVANNVVLKRLKNNATANVKVLSGFINWGKDKDDWSLSVDKLKFVTEKSVWPETHLDISRKFDPATSIETFNTQVKYVRIEDVRDLLLKSGYVDNRVFKYLRNASPSGEVKDIQYNTVTQINSDASPKKSNKKLNSSNKIKEYFLSAKVNNLAFNAFEKIPGIKGITGEIYSNQNSGVLHVNSEKAGLDFKGLLAAPVSLNSLSGNVEWIKNNGIWDFTSKEIKVSNDDLTATASIKLNLPEGTLSPFLDLQVNIEKANATAIKKYLPLIIMKGEFKEWVDKAFVAGDIKDGGIVLNGRLNQFPFNNNEGVFKVHIPANNLVMNYRDNWPALKNGEVEATITGQGIKVDAKHAELLNSSSENFTVEIESFEKPLVKLRTKVKSSADDVAQFASTTFLKNSRSFVQSSSFTGDINIDAALDIPLSKEIEKLYPFDVKAKANIINASLKTLKNKIEAEKINGVVDISKNSVNATSIKAKILNGDSTIDVFTRHEFGGHPVRLVMQGNIDVSDTMKRFKIPGYDKVKGRTDWQGVLTLQHKQDNTVKNQTFQIAADMKNVAITLPTPMNKPTGKTVPTYMTVENVSKDTMLMHVVHGEAMSYAMNIDLSDKQARLRRGEFRFKTEAAQIPDDDYLLVTGSLWDFSLRDWLDALDPTSDKNKKSFLGIPTKVDMDILHLAKAKKLKPRKPADPRKLPTFEGVIDQFEYDTFQYGTARFKTEIEPNGVRLKRFTINSPHVAVEGQAFWHYRPHKQTTEMTMNLVSENYGELLTSLGFASIIEDGNANFSGDFNWDGGFGDFSWEKLNGVVTMDVTNGAITKVDPGAGRLLGVLSIESLPGMLFTGDAFKSGFNFDRMVGAFEILDGEAYSDDVSVSGPAASMLVTGRTGIVKRDFDQYITVVPNVSGTLPLTSGFVFGPQVGAVVYFFKKLFGSGIDESSKRIYHVTGTWKKPLVERIDKNVEKSAVKETKDESDDEL